MTTLLSCCDNGLTDKNTVHSYLSVYEALFAPKRLTAQRVLEIGIGPTPHQNGGSIRMWSLYFPQADIHTCDIIPLDHVHSCLLNHPRIHLHTSNNAYNMNFVTTMFTSKNMTFDILVDDGPHTLPSMLAFITMYLPLLKEDGILVIEDVQDIAWIDQLRNITPDAFKPYIEVYDRRDVKGRYDDIMFVINKTIAK
jgi:8-demethyl-8-alpha-L-rhamnosyltetracenomycin-C 2'-O-methyltransferase